MLISRTEFNIIRICREFQCPPLKSSRGYRRYYFLGSEDRCEGIVVGDECELATVEVGLKLANSKYE